jgi:hypothetical protein
MAQKERKKRVAKTGHFTETGDGAQVWTTKTNKFGEAEVKGGENS